MKLRNKKENNILPKIIFVTTNPYVFRSGLQKL